MSVFFLILDNLQGITDAKELSFAETHDNAATRASVIRGRLLLVNLGASLAPVNEISALTAHLGLIERLQYKGAGIVHWRVVHLIHTLSESVLCGRKRAIFGACHRRIIVAIAQTRVSVSVHGVLA